MSQPIGSFILTGVPEIPLAVGYLVNASAKLEWNLFYLYEMLSGSPPDIARTTFYGMTNFRTKVETVKAVAETALPASKAQKVADVLDRAYRRMKVRNRYVHNPIAHFSTGEICMLKMTEKPRSHDLEQISAKDIDQATAELDKASDEIHALTARLRPDMPALLQEHRQKPGVSLLYAKKGAPRRTTKSKQ